MYKTKAEENSHTTNRSSVTLVNFYTLEMGEQFTPPDHVGQSVTEVPKPAAILDVAKVKRHCNSMLEAARSLGLGFRAHVKTHKVSRTLLSVCSQL